MEKRMNKKAQNITLGTLILIVLGVIVLVFLVFGFSMGWGNLWDKVTNFIGGGYNVKTVERACSLACASENYGDWCTLKRTVKYGGKEVRIGGKNVKSVVGTCDEMATKGENFPEVHVESCAKIQCKP